MFEWEGLHDYGAGSHFLSLKDGVQHTCFCFSAVPSCRPGKHSVKLNIANLFELT